ncbi:MAG: SGNH/GDSL hydrolase family protein [Moraxellaceae bacterium]|nr:SGNH/GDSL hydrolase family protein [Moraxellaceae bacterium]
MFFKPKHFLFAPIYYYQGKTVKEQTIELPEPSGARKSVFSLENSQKNPYRLVIIGDSSAVGVGVAEQKQALAVQLVSALAKKENFQQNYSEIDWQLHAKTGDDSFDVLRRFYILPKSTQSLDCLIIVVGVNDVTKMQSLNSWQQNLTEIVKIAKHKFAPKRIIFTAIPPLEIFPNLPYPLNQFMGEKAQQLNDSMEIFCNSMEYIDFVEFNLIDKNPNIKDYFAKDGFHPSALTYQLWAEALANLI